MTSTESVVQAPTSLSKKDIAIDFVRRAAAGDARAAFNLHVARDFRHHNPAYQSDAESLIDAIEENTKEYPDKVFEVQRALADGDLVAVHSRVRMKPGDARGGAVVHFFRFQGNQIVEMWDVGQLEPEESPNELGMF